MPNAPLGIIGAFIFWILKGFKGRFDELYNDKYNFRNMVVSLIVFLLFIYFYFYR